MPDKTILIVDDTPANIAAALAILKDQYRTRVATGGAKALEHAGAADKPDLILLDVTMPEMDGYEVCGRLKADPQTASIPVVFLTARTEAEDEAKGFELGAVDYIHKPFNPTVVRARVHTHLLLRDTLKQIEERNAALDEKTRMLESLSVKLSKYLSPQVYASIFTGSRDVELATERKRLTVFFSDIKDFTATTADMQPEDLTAMLNRYFTAMSKIALAHGAHIDKFIGDAMLMFFGDPETRGVEEDARACVRMAVAMQRQMVELQQEWRASGCEQPFEMRVGINTGYCNVGNFGSDDRMDYTIIGAEVNLAARIEAAADPGGILISYPTYALVRDIVRAEERDSITAKGIRREVRVFAVAGILDDHDPAPGARA
ncbi:MAG: adenylate/guanylate cyclase domain-containing protein [Stellaceae bacterium]